ncbi:intron Large complex component GCFC2 isoform 2-T2 [Pholidichthys leucotaenia]
MFKKPRRNFRQRKDSSSEDEDQQKNGGGGEGNEETPIALVNKLSKVAQSRGISCSSKRETTPPKPDSSDREDWGTEDREERQKDKEGAQKKTAILSFTDEKEDGESTFKLKKLADKAVLFQARKKETPAAKPTHRTASGGGGIPPTSSRQNDGSPDSLHHEDDGDDDNDDNDRGIIGAASPSATSSSDSSYSATKPVIPNAEEIEAARRQRHAARAQKEFIPLDRDCHSSASSTPNHCSREDEDDIVTDDDNEPDDHERRIEFAPRLKSTRERIAEKLGGSDGSLSGSEEEEQELWEETQIGKGVKRQPGEQSPSGSDSSGSSRQRKRTAGVKIPKCLPPVTVSVVKRRITGKLDSLKEVHRARQAELRKLENDVESAKTSMENLEESSSERQLKFYRTMNVYVRNLVECLQQKIIEIYSLERELHTLLSHHTEALLAQRRQKVKEQADHLQQLSYNIDEQSENSATGTKTQSNVGTSFIEEDFIPGDTQPSAKEEENLQKSIADIMLRSQAVFSDVQDDFCNIQKILSRFEEWRGSHSESYHSAYVFLCLPKLLNPIVRHQLLTWNPLKKASGDFENLPWFTAVETFCHGHGHEELEHADRQTLCNVIERTVIPKITAFVELVWDPMSHQQSACLSDVCHRLKEDYSIFEGEQSKPVKACIEAVVCRLRTCVDEDIFIPLYPKKFLEDKSSPQCLFRDQQFWTAVKLLGNMGKWDLLPPESVLKELMLDKLLNRYLMITLCSQTLNSDVHACKKIADSLPFSWFKEESTCLPQLQIFRNHVVQKVDLICKQKSPEDPNTRSAMVELLKVLSKIRSFDSIMAIAEKYHYEDIIYSHQLLNPEAV